MDNIFQCRNKGTRGLQSTPLLLLGVVTILFASAASLQAQTTEAYNWDNVSIGGGGFVSGIITNKTDKNLMYARTDVGGAYRYNRTTGEWIPLTDFASDAQQGILGVESLATDPVDPKNLYLLTGIAYFNSGTSYILRSSDYGATFSVVNVTSQFKAHGNGMGRQSGEKLQVDPNKNSVLYCGTRYNGLFKSTNSGAAWSRLTGLNITTTPNENGVSFVVVDKSSGVNSSGQTQRLFAGISTSGSNTNFYRSNDAGATFSAIDNPSLPDNYIPQRAVQGGDYLFITYGNGAGPYGTTAEPYNSGQIWRYTIASGAWANVTPKDGSGNAVNKAFCGISVDPANSSRLVASTTNNYSLQGTAYGDHFYYSTNGGTSWTDVVARGYTLDPNGITWVSGQSIHWAGSIEFDPSNTARVFVTSGNGIFANDNIASSGNWKFTVKELEETVPLNLVSIPGGSLISVIGDYDGFRHTDPAQYAPQHNPRMGTTTGLAYGVTNKNKIVRVGSSMYYSNDMGVNWTKTSVINGSKGQVAVSADGNTILHSPEASSTTYRSTTNGASWSTVSGLNISNARPVADGATNGKFYAYDGGSGNFLMSTNGGANFSATSSAPGSGGSRVIRTVPGRDGDVWVALGNGGLTYTENSGGTWTDAPGVTYCSAVGIGKTASGGIYETIFIYGTVGGVRGIFRSTNKGNSWVRVNDDAHEYGGPANGEFIVGDMNTYGRVYMSTAGRGIVMGSVQGCTPTNITPYIQVNGGAFVQTGTATLDAGGTVKMGPQPVTTTGWTWTGPNGFGVATREVTLSNVQANDAGNYTAVYTNTSGCSSSYQFTITVTNANRTVASADKKSVNLLSVINEKRLMIYPNPSATAFTINQKGACTYTISDIAGRVVERGKFVNNSLAGAKLTKGIYLIEVKNGEESKTLKLMKE